MRNVGEQVVEAIIAARRDKGRFTDFFDFCEKVDIGVLNKRVIESLIKAAPSTPWDAPARLFEVHEVAVDRVTARKRAEAAGQFSLFGGLGDGDEVVTEPLPVVGREEWEKSQRLAFEGRCSASTSPTTPAGLEHVLQRAADTSLSSLTGRRRRRGDRRRSWPS